MDLEAIQSALRERGLDGWLFYDFRGSDPIAYRILGLDPEGHATRRWYYYIPAEGEPTAIVHAIESKALAGLPGRTQVYLPWGQLHSFLEETIPSGARIAMQYSPQNSIPYVSRVDGGTLEFIRSLGVEPVTSAELVQLFEATLSAEQIAGQQRATTAIGEIVKEAFGEIWRRVSGGEEVNEFQIQKYILDQFSARNLVTDYPPVVAVGANAADPHYCPVAETAHSIKRDDFVLIDLWAKEEAEGSIFGDITWVAYFGDEIPDEIIKVFSIVRDARDAGIEFLKKGIGSDGALKGCDVDDAVRNVIAGAGYGEYFIHRTGHSIYTDVHGNGANIDNLETKDDRLLMPNTCFSIEPGIYLPGKFGVRSEVDIILKEGDVIVSGPAPQQEIWTPTS